MAAVAEKKTEVQGTHLLVRKYTGQYPTNTIAWMESLFQVSSKIIQIKHEKIQYDGLTDNTDDILLVILEDQFFLLNVSDMIV